MTAAPKGKGAGGEEGTRPRMGLGRGLASLLSDPSAPAADGRDHRTVPVEFLRPNPRNPRRHFEATDLDDLASSIRAKGILQPIIVRAIPNVAGSYEIVAGERRWRAGQAAGLTEAPVIIIEADDKEALAFALVENVQRADLNAIEEATAYERLGREFGYSQTDLSAMIGKSRSHVANTVRLLKLPAPVIDLLASGALSAGHARALLACAQPEALAARVVAEGLTVRDVEAIAREEAAPPANKPQPVRQPPSAQSRALAASLSRALGLAVSHHERGTVRELRIRYESDDQLARLTALLGDAGPT